MDRIEGYERLGLIIKEKKTQVHTKFPNIFTTKPKLKDKLTRLVKDWK